MTNKLVSSYIGYESKETKCLEVAVEFHIYGHMRLSKVIGCSLG